MYQATGVQTVPQGDHGRQQVPLPQHSAAETVPLGRDYAFRTALKSSLRLKQRYALLRVFVGGLFDPQQTPAALHQDHDAGRRGLGAKYGQQTEEEVLEEAVGVLVRGSEIGLYEVLWTARLCAIHREEATGCPMATVAAKQQRWTRTPQCPSLCGPLSWVKA